MTPDLADLAELAERALAHAAGDTQATVVWERGSSLAVELTTVIDGRAAQARATGTDDSHLQRAGHAAAVLAGRPRAWPAPALPQPPAAARPHEGFDPAALAEPAPPPPAPDGVRLTVRTGASRVAIASTTGLRAAEQRSFAVAEAAADAGGGRSVRLRRAAVAMADLDLRSLAEEARALAALGGGPAELPAGDLPVVLGPDAVATVLEHLRGAFGVDLDLGSGPFAGRFGTRVAAAAVNLSDSPRYLSTLPRSYDAEGMPRTPVPLIQDGVAHRRVHDSASAARAGAESTGHATRAAALAPLPEHLVLVGGGAAGVDELAAPVTRGLYVPALSPGREGAGDGAFLHRTLGAVLIEGGGLAKPVADAEVVVDPAAVLASVEALTARTRVLPLPGQAPGGIGAAVVPALRAAAGVRRR